MEQATIKTVSMTMMEMTRPAVFPPLMRQKENMSKVLIDIRRRESSSTKHLRFVKVTFCNNYF